MFLLGKGHLTLVHLGAAANIYCRGRYIATNPAVQRDSPRIASRAERTRELAAPNGQAVLARACSKLGAGSGWVL